MVLPSNSLPADESWVAREIAALKRQMQELTSSVAGLPAIQAQQASIIAQQAALATQQTSLATTVGRLQAQVAFSSNDAFLYNLNLTTSATATVAFDGTFDQSVTITNTYPVAINAVAWFGFWMSQSVGSPSNTGFGDMSVTLERVGPDGTVALYIASLDLSSEDFAPFDTRGASAPVVSLLQAGATYTFRTRRSYAYTRVSGSTIPISYQTYPIVVVKQFV